MKYKVYKKKAAAAAYLLHREVYEKLHMPPRAWK